MTAQDLRAELTTLLSDGPTAAIERERTAFDRIAQGRYIVLFGAGGLGRRTAIGLQSAGIQTLAFIDNDKSLWGRDRCGIQILPPYEAQAKYRDSAIYIVTIAHAHRTERMRDRIDLLRDLGCETVCTYGPLYWKYQETFLPWYAAAPAHEVYQYKAEILKAGDLWSDSASREEYLSQVKWRLSFDFDVLSTPVTHAQYLAPDLYMPSKNEVFVDCGAYDGDTFRSMPAFGKYFGFEPDQVNFDRLCQCAGSVEGVSLRRAAVGRRAKMDNFASGLGGASKIGGCGMDEVEVVSLDDLFPHDDNDPTWIKMDIEGSELAALHGARHIIERATPMLTISVYHRQSDLWKIPLLIRSFNSEYEFFLRTHMTDGWDAVCYAVPKAATE